MERIERSLNFVSDGTYMFHDMPSLLGRTPPLFSVKCTKMYAFDPFST